ncbi:unnamed protein product [Didymodactylos carnosus]|uniref:Uncharacterized protein n=1 Tax=Didymodactylos carnosus TaxID=1234261 RepID=A0A815ZUE9_9BILA|nr:unnamed protein product [Didymodactylos carnosus]CAF1587845.1 unnamed protein product [Didymodactylos carnosus]CAF4325895.1 unnamed protein product [Didymodactylos carnosus]CAF4458497.1 unnamed protein product [Didymodactylos carnosus]
MRFTFIVLCTIALLLSLTTAVPIHNRRTQRGLVPDLSGLSGLFSGTFTPVCLFSPCNGPSFLFPEIDWDALHASIAQWTEENGHLLQANK